MGAVECHSCRKHLTHLTHSRRTPLNNEQDELHQLINLSNGLLTSKRKEMEGTATIIHFIVNYIHLILARQGCSYLAT